MLHDVDDVEELCARVARAFCRRTGTRLLREDLDGLVAFLIVETWRLSEKFQPASPTASFRSYAHSILPRKCIDFMRGAGGSPFKRTRWKWANGVSYERQHVVPLSLDAPARRDDGDPLGAALGAIDERLEAAGGAHDFGGLLVDRRSEEDWDPSLCRALARRLLRERTQAAAERKRVAKQAVSVPAS